MSVLLAVDRLEVRYPVRSALTWGRQKREYVQAVAGVSFELGAGEAVALVGESGCGKTTVARAILGIAAMSGGAIAFDGQDLPAGTDVRPQAFRRQVQMVFQDPFDSLNPRKTILQTLAQPLRIHAIVPARDIEAQAVRLLEAVGLSPGGAYLHRYPHQFSGGQRQRVCIARAIAVRPRLIVADEAVSALDISIRAQILALLRDLQRALSLAMLFITHDLGVVRSLCDRVLVMYLGQVVEEGRTEDVFSMPRHPYTRALLAASPLPDPVKARARQRLVLGGDVPSPVHPPAGCRFHPRCPFVQPRCRIEAPQAQAFEPGHVSRCHFAGDATRWAER